MPQQVVRMFADDAIEVCGAWHRDDERARTEEDDHFTGQGSRDR